MCDDLDLPHITSIKVIKNVRFGKNKEEKLKKEKRKKG